MLLNYFLRLAKQPPAPTCRKSGNTKRAARPQFRPSLQALESRELLSVAPVSVATSGAAMGNGNSVATTRMMSADGVYQVFTSGALNLVNNVNVAGFISHVYLRNLNTGTTSLVDINPAGTDSSNGGGAITPSITADGRYIAFAATATNLTSNDATAPGVQIYVRDMKLGQTFMVTLNKAGTNGGNGDVITPVVGVGNGALTVAYASKATDLTAGDTSTNYQLFATTFQLNASTGAIQYNTLKTILVSSTSTGNGGNGDSAVPLISTDGATLAFSSKATDLNIPGSLNVNTNVTTSFYSYSFATKALRALSVEPTTGTSATGNQSAFLSQAPLSGQAHFQSMSADGHYAIFESASDNLVPKLITNDQTNVYRRNLATGVTELVSINPAHTAGVDVGTFAREGVISADGRYVAFSSNSGDLTINGGFGGIFVRDMVQGQTYFVSLAMDGSSAGGSHPSIGKTASGKLVIAYNSNATNLTPNDTNNSNPQVFVTTFNLDAGGNIQYNTRATVLVSATSTGNGGNGDCSPPIVSADGSTVAFTTRAQNLVGETPDNTDGVQHIQAFMYKVATGTLIQVSGGATATTTTDATQLTTISDNGQYLAYVLTTTDFVHLTSSAEITGYNSAAGVNTPVYSSNGAPFPAFGQTVISADGSTIAFAAANALSFGADYVVSNWQGGGSATQIAISPAGLPDSIGAPVVSGDGKVIAYTYQPNGHTPFQLYIYSNGTAKAAGAVANGMADTPLVSTDGSTVLFTSTGNDIVPGILDFVVGQTKVYSYSVSGNTFSLVSAKAPGLYTIDQSAILTNLSDNGRYIAYQTGANDLFANTPFLAATAAAQDLQSGGPVAVVSIMAQMTAVVLSGDGSTVVFTNDASLSSIPTTGLQVYSSNWQAANPTIKLVSVNNQGTGGENGTVFSPSVSGNGQIIAFQSDSTNLVNIPNGGGQYQIYLRNMTAGTTIMASTNSAGTAGGNQTSQTPFVSMDGSVVGFTSLATDLLSNVMASGGFSQVYVNVLSAHASAIAASSGSGQSANTGASFGAPLVATLTDQLGHPITGVTVTFTGPGSGAGVAFPSGNTAITNAQGQASVAVAANGTAGSFAVTASAAGIAAPASFSLTNIAPASSKISGTVFQDYNLDGQQNGGEPGLTGQTLYLDLNNNGVLDAGEPSTTSAASGSYSLSGLAAGTYVVRQVLLGGVLLDMPSSGNYQVTVNGTSNITSQNFGNVLTNIAAPLTIPPSTPFPSQGNANADYVQALFRSLLLRNADQGGLSFWTGQLNSGAATRPQVVEGIRKSVERFTNAVADFYETLLGRQADANGQAFWVGQLQSNVREEQIAISFLNSPEYVGKGDKFFVDSMYKALLGRALDPVGEQFWLGQLGDNDQGQPVSQPKQTHAQVVNNFLFSQESLERLVEGYYEVYLQRHADTNGLNGWVAQLQQGLPFVSIGEQFLSSDEFFNAAASK